MKKETVCPGCERDPQKHAGIAPLAKRISGQIGGVVKMIEEDRYCPDILNQIRAVRAALRTLEGRVLQTHLQSCVRDAFASGKPKVQEEKIEEILALFGRYEGVGD